MFEELEDVDWGCESPVSSTLHDVLFNERSTRCVSVKRKRKSHDESCKLSSTKKPSPLHSFKKEFAGPKPSKSSRSSGMKKKLTFQAKLEKKMDGARFRWINEQLYTTTGEEAKRMFEGDCELFKVYHLGFSAQVSKWPVNPLKRILSYVRSLPVDLVVADFGCGEAKLAQSVLQKVFSFDLVACNSHVIACDMATVPLEVATVDVCVFCLSLMGTNVSDFIKEARRVMVINGKLKICEIVSRMSSLVEFVLGVESYGFQLLSKEVFSTMFVDLEFKAIPRKTNDTTPVEIILKPCSYKRR
ncbi:ribosomal RNA-processing protein 8-like [Halichondria panicea]|uniref:ribosomal RNA-processing protein 8-like n=1 Tax=Halichondria panicea TaxID=6063 RepID=UPI00312BAC53